MIKCVYVFISLLIREHNIAAESPVEKIGRSSFELGFDALRIANKIETDVENPVFSPLSLLLASPVFVLGFAGSTLNEVFNLLRLNDSFKTADKSILQTFTEINNDKVLYASVDNSTLALGSLLILSLNQKTGKQFDDFFSDYKYASLVFGDFDEQGHQILQFANEFADCAKTKSGRKVNERFGTQSSAVFINCAVFSGKFVVKFDSEFTKQATFTNKGNEKSTILFMRTVAALNYGETDKGSFVQIPYESGHNLYLLAPKDYTSAVKCVQTMNYATFSELLKSLTVRTIDISFPMFDLTTNLRASQLYYKPMQTYFSSKPSGMITTDKWKLSDGVITSSFRVTDHGRQLQKKNESTLKATANVTVNSAFIAMVTSNDNKVLHLLIFVEKL